MEVVDIEEESPDYEAEINQDPNDKHGKDITYKLVEFDFFQ